jgi:hypothetical protein
VLTFAIIEWWFVVAMRLRLRRAHITLPLRAAIIIWSHPQRVIFACLRSFLGAFQAFDGATSKHRIELPWVCMGVKHEFLTCGDTVGICLLDHMRYLVRVRVDLVYLRSA